MKKLAFLLAIIFIFGQTSMAENAFDEALNQPFSADRVLNGRAWIPASVYVVNTNGDTNDALPGDGFCDDGNGLCSLRAAITEANASAGANIIDFDIPGACPQLIAPNTALPTITETVTIDGYSQPGTLTNTHATQHNATICVQLSGGNSLNTGLTVDAPNTIVRGLSITSWLQQGVFFSGGSVGSALEGNYIGINADGNAAGTNNIGVTVQASGVRIGGDTLPARNIISGNRRFGVSFFDTGANNTANLVYNNLIGPTASGVFGNGESGVSIFRSRGNRIGGVGANQRNVISGNGRLILGGLDGSGVYIFGDQLFNNSQNNQIVGNYIGTNWNGLGAMGNATNGVKIEGASGTAINSNVISGNPLDGIGISGASVGGNTIKSNVIGFLSDISTRLGNGRDGVSITSTTTDSTNTVIGGTGPNDGNWIGGNTRYGIYVTGSSNGNSVQGNRIGYAANQVPAPQTGGILIATTQNTVGGTTASARNFIAGNSSFGLAFVNGGSNTAQGNHFGLTHGLVVLNSTSGIFVQDSSDNTIGGTVAGAGNVVSGNTFGIRLISFGPAVSNNLIAGNIVGTDPNGTFAIPNFQGILVQGAGNNTIGSTNPLGRNLISGNQTDGISLQNDSANNSVLGNYVGTSLDGLTAIPNGTGIKIDGAGSLNNQIGGASTGSENLVSGNTQAGIQLQNSANNNTIRRNTIGLKSDLAVPLPNGNGIGLILQAHHNTVGSVNSGEGNIISGNSASGVILNDGANNNSIIGNKIGTDPTGTIDLGNGLNGVRVLSGGAGGSTFNLIGNGAVGGGNLISGNNGGGVFLLGSNSNGNKILGNLIGTTANGSDYLRNNLFGVRVEAPETQIGGPLMSERNVISGHIPLNDHGILITGNGTNALVQNNLIGLNAAGTTAIFNGIGISVSSAGFGILDNVISGSSFGVFVGNAQGGYFANNKFGTKTDGTGVIGNGYTIFLSDSRNIRIGEDASGAVAPNLIANSTIKGISMVGSNCTGNLIRQNSIYDSANLGIDLGNDGVTQNDPGDADLTPNNNQNFPVIDYITTTINGKLNSNPFRSYRIEFFSSPTGDASGYGEGRTYFTETTVNTDANGDATFSIPNTIPAGGFISATATDLTSSETSEFSATKQVLVPTAVKFAGARATKFENGVLLEWQTGQEADNLGFNVYRERAGNRELLTESPVAGSALLTQAALQSGFEYQWFDANGPADSAYFIEAVDLDGTTEIFGVFGIERTVSENWDSNNSTTFKNINNRTEEKTVFVEPTAKRSPVTKAQMKIAETLSKFEGVRISVKKSSFYRLTAAELFANGLPNNIDFNNLRLFAEGLEQPFNILFNEKGGFTGIEFYGAGIETRETNLRVYQLVASSGPGRRLEKIESTGTPNGRPTYRAEVLRRDRTTYFSGLLNGDEENFFGATVGSAGVDQVLTISRVVPNTSDAELTVKLQGLSRTLHNVRVDLNGQYLDTISFSALQKGVLNKQIPSSLLREGANNVRLQSVGSTNDFSLVDEIRLNFTRQLHAENNALSFVADAGQPVTLQGFTTKFVRVFDITDADHPVELKPQMMKGRGILTEADLNETEEPDELGARNYVALFTPQGTGQRRILAVSDAVQPEAVEPNFASSLRQNKGADLVIISKRGFFDELQPLANLRKNQGLTPMIVDINDVYDEFGYGQKSTNAMRDFLQTAFEHWTLKPKYVILAGDASFDPKRFLNSAEDVVPTRLVDTLLLETASDDWLADFNRDGWAELAVGRLPAQNEKEMSVLVGKLLNYNNQSVSNSMMFVSDITDGFDFAGTNGAVREILPESIEATELRRGEMSDANVRNQILSKLNSGQKIVSYVGHGSTLVWRGNVFSKSDAQNLTNGAHLPVFVTMTCLNGFFHDAVNTGLGETLMKNPNGGSIAVLSSSGTVLPDSYGALNLEFHRRILNGATLGEAHLEAKRIVTNMEVLQTWNLLGDPSMPIR